MVGDATLRVVIRAYLRRAVTRRDHGLTARSDVIDIFLVLLIIDLRAQARERAFLILRLVTRLGTLDEYLLDLAGIGVFPVIAQPYARLYLVHILSSGTTGTECLPFDLAFIDMHLKLIRFGQYGNRCRRGMDTALRLGHGYALHAMYTGFVLERTVDVLTGHIEDDLLIAAYGAFVEGRDGLFESFDLEILGVHAEEVTGKNSRLVTACTATNLHNDVLAVLGILG